MGLKAGGWAWRQVCVCTYWEAGHVLLGRARVNSWSAVERAAGNAGKMHREVAAMLGFEAGPGRSERCCVQGPSVPTQLMLGIPRAYFEGKRTGVE